MNDLTKLTAAELELVLVDQTNVIKARAAGLELLRRYRLLYDKARDAAFRGGGASADARTALGHLLDFDLPREPRTPT